VYRIAFALGLDQRQAVVMAGLSGLLEQDATLLQLNEAKRGYRADADGAHTSTLRARHSRWNVRVETHSVWQGFEMQRGRECLSLGETRSRATRRGAQPPGMGKKSL
jgi:hypothetical protein